MFEGIIFFTKTCWKFNKKYIFLLIFKQVLAITNTISMIILPKYILDSLFTNMDLKSTNKYLIILVAVSLVVGLLSSFTDNEILVQKMDVFKEFQIYLGKKMMDAEFQCIESQKFLDLKSKAERFLYGNGSGFATVLENSFSIFGKICSCAALIGIITQLNVFLIIVLIVIVLIDTFVNIRTQKRNINLNLQKAVKERRCGYFSNIFQDFQYGKEIRVYNLSEWLTDKYRNQLNILQKFYKKMAVNNFKYNFITIITSAFQLALCYVYVIRQALNRVISVGQFSMYLSSINTFSSTLKDVIFGLVDIQQYNSYYTAFKEYINLDSITKPKELKCPITDDFIIEFQNVYFKYQYQTSYALEDISVTINSRDKISIVGENGAGKSTFVKLLLRIYKPTKGRILLNGTDIQDIDYSYYISLFSTVFQDYRLLSMPIRDNIALNKEADDVLINNILSKVGVKDKIDKFDKGINTMIYKDFDNNGFIPSGGEGQKIAIARAVYRQTPIVILDEPTASLDARAEFEIYSEFDELFGDRTCLYISHRLASSKLCNKIFVFSGGRLIEQGTQTELLDSKGLFYNLYTMQLGLYK